MVVAMTLRMMLLTFGDTSRVRAVAYQAVLTSGSRLAQ
jgi:hypothetical protein